MPNIVLYLNSSISRLHYDFVYIHYKAYFKHDNFEEKGLNNFPICRLSNVKNDNIPTAILKCCLLAPFLCVIILMLMLFFLMLTTLIWEYKNCQITSISNSFRSLIVLTTNVFCKGIDFISVHYDTSMCENYISELYLVNFETKNVLDLVLHTGFKTMDQIFKIHVYTNQNYSSCKHGELMIKTTKLWEKKPIQLYPLLWNHSVTLWLNYSYHAPKILKLYRKLWNFICYEETMVLY